MSDTDAELAALRKALGSPTLEAEYEGHRVKYRSVAEIERAIARLEKTKAAAAGSASRTTYATFSSD